MMTVNFKLRSLQKKNMHDGQLLILDWLVCHFHIVIQSVFMAPTYSDAKLLSNLAKVFTLILNQQKHLIHNQCNVDC